MAVIRLTILLKARPDEVFQVFFDEKKHAKLINASAKIDPREGGKFSLWGGDVSGETVDFEKDKRILQKWRSSDWEKEAISTVEFEFYPTRNGTRLVLTQKGVPEEHRKDIEEGWREYYFGPLTKLFNTGKQ